MFHPKLDFKIQHLILLSNAEPDFEISAFAKRTVKDLNLSMAFITLIAQSIQVNYFHNTLSYEKKNA